MKEYQKYLDEKLNEDYLDEAVVYFSPENVQMMVNALTNPGVQSLPINILSYVIWAMIFGVLGMAGKTFGIFDAIKDFFRSVKQKVRGFVMGMDAEKNIEDIKNFVVNKKSELKPGERRYLESIKNKFVEAIKNKDREEIANLFDQIFQYKKEVN